MVAAVSEQHQHHGRAESEVNRRLAADEPMFVAAPTLVEAYAVLTRMPLGSRLAPDHAIAVLQESFVRRGEIVSLDAGSYLELLRGAPRRGIAGGRVYDAVIAACAERAGISTLVTFNVTHFRLLLPPTVEILAPPEP
jgi:predicted nucleic acid-binding protein